MEETLNNLVKSVKVLKKLLREQKKEIKNIENYYLEMLKQSKSVFVQHIDVGDAFAEEFRAKALAEKNSEEIRKQVEEEVDNKIEANIQENAEQVLLDGEPDFDLLEEQAEENAPTGL